MENFGKRALPHLIGLLVYSAILRLMDKPSGAGMIIYLAIIICIHVIVCFFISLIKFFNKKKSRRERIFANYSFSFNHWIWDLFRAFYFECSLKKWY
jgi:hypothetical protein